MTKEFRNDLNLDEQHIKGYETIDGVEVPIIHCPTKTIVTNTVTGVTYESEAAAKADVEDVNTETTESHLKKDVQITVANLSLFGATK
tara:strand:+ start:1070 stop:1333 length:264 start_codon:yes stop_codon:yes gene_type:complete